MTSIIDKISPFRKERQFSVDHNNSNRYRIVANESDGTQTAYYFSTPIYNQKTKKSLNTKFHSNNRAFFSTGSNADITIAEHIRIENTEGTCMISLSGYANSISDDEIVCGNETIYPTTNGIAIKSSCHNGKMHTFSIEICKRFFETKANDKYFAIMTDRFRPFLSVSCIGTSDENGSIISPAKLSYKNIGKGKYSISIVPCSSLGESVWFEINLYEPKLFQDTTVESNAPKKNNVFGGTAFIGNTEVFGVQWLYSRPDLTKLQDLKGKMIREANLYLPILNETDISLSAYGVSSRFCSFGSNWNNKKPATNLIAVSEKSEGYHKLNVTSMISHNGKLKEYLEGFVLKPSDKTDGFSVISTSDSYYKPTIFAINYF